MATLKQPALLIVDEIGYLPVTSNGANRFFQLVNARYGLLHHCHIVNVQASTVVFRPMLGRGGWDRKRHWRHAG